MPYEDIWSENSDGLYKRVYGDISVIDVLAENNAMFQNQQFDNLKYVIYDFREVTSSGPLKPEELGSVAKVVRIRSNTQAPMKLAIISRNNSDSINAAKSFCQLLCKTFVECRAFLELEEAKFWVMN